MPVAFHEYKESDNADQEQEGVLLTSKRWL